MVCLHNSNHADWYSIFGWVWLAVSPDTVSLHPEMDGGAQHGARYWQCCCTWSAWVEEKVEEKTDWFYWVCFWIIIMSACTRLLARIWQSWDSSDFRGTVKPALAATWIRRSPPHCGQLGKVPKFEPIVSILYCSSIAVTCVMRNAVTLLHPKHAIARYITHCQ